MTDQDMRELVESYLQAQFERNRLIVDTPKRSTPAAAASSSDLAALQAHVHQRGLRIPTSYRQFLSLFDGIERFRSLDGLDLFSAQQVVANAPEYDDEDEFEPVCHFVIGGGMATVMLGFDPDTADEAGDMAVVEFSTGGDATEHANFVEFLRFHRDLFRRRTIVLP